MKRYLAMPSVVLLMIGCGTAHSFSNQDLANLCSRVNEIRTMPFKGEHVEDEMYNKLLEAGDSVIPCLIDKVADTTIMPDPRQAPVYDGITVGDVAFFVFLDISGQEMKPFLPENVKAEYDKHGVYAYFRFVESPDNRMRIQEGARQWFHNRRESRAKNIFKKPEKAKAEEWPEIQIKSVSYSKQASAYIAVIEVDKRSRIVMEELFDGLEIHRIDAVKGCLLVGKHGSDTEREFCKKD